MLRALDTENPALRHSGAFQWLDAELADNVRRERVIGASQLVTALVVWRRNRRAAPEQSLASASTDRLAELSAAEVFALHTVYILGTREFVRGVLLGSRLWFLLWPLYLYLAAKIGSQIPADSVAEATVEEQSVRQLAGLGDAFWHRDLQPV